MSPPSLDYMQHHETRAVVNPRRLLSISKSTSALDDTASLLQSSCSFGDLSLLELAYQEIAQLRQAEQQQAVDGDRQAPPPVVKLVKFPPACLALVGTISGNRSCVDCGSRNPQWASISYGALLCLQCSGHHRSLGVAVSCVRSLYMDDWSVTQILSLLEGGNGQVKDFFARHLLCQDTVCMSTTEQVTKSNVTRFRYKTKAALFYRQQMALHIQQILLAPDPYRGRNIPQRNKRPAQSPRALHSSTSTLE